MPELGRLTVLDGDLAIAYLPQFGAPQHGERLGFQFFCRFFLDDGAVVVHVALRFQFFCRFFAVGHE